MSGEFTSQVVTFSNEEIPELLQWAQRHKLVLYNAAIRYLWAIRENKDQGLHVCGDECRTVGEHTELPQGEGLK